MCRLENDAGGGGEDDLSPLLRRIFENRNVRTRGELDYSLDRLLPAESLKGIDSATTILQQALAEQWNILVVGDYDVDGATASTLALLGLRALGAARADYLVPNRFVHGYGLSEEIARIALTRSPNLVVTVDNGISSIEGVALLRAAGVAVIVTDHHLAGAELPAANAVVNPNQPGCEFPSKALAGVGVMFYVLLSLRTRLRESGWFSGSGGDNGGGGRLPQPNLAALLDLVALGTVADMVPLDHNNRILVAQGIARIRGGHCRPGVKALAEVTGKRCQNLDASDLGFFIGPRLNAAGRMDDISTGIECLLADDQHEALRIARLLDQMNAQRHRVQQSMQRQAAQMVARLEQGGGKPERAGWCLFDPDWHQGIIGLVASRVVEKSNQPVVAFAPGDDGRLRGSARSVAGLHIRDLLAAIATRHPGLIEKFGGHAMAAGLTLSAERFDAFSDCFSELVGDHFKDNAPRDDILTDGELAEEELSLETAERMRRASPWGQHFPAPLFDGEFRVLEQKAVGQGGQHLKMTMERIGGGQSRRYDAIAFRHVEPGEEAARLDVVHAVYQLQVNEYRGRRSLQLLVEYLRART